MLKVATVAAITYVFGFVFTPEFFEFLTAAMVTINTVILVRASRRVRDDIGPKLDHVAETADKAVNIVERRRLDRPDPEARTFHGRGDTYGD